MSSTLLSPQLDSNLEQNVAALAAQIDQIPAEVITKYLDKARLLFALQRFQIAFQNLQRWANVEDRCLIELEWVLENEALPIPQYVAIMRLVNKVYGRYDKLIEMLKTELDVPEPININLTIGKEDKVTLDEA